ncbi:MAG: fibro-slime domain-containing protein [Collinsella sp.]|nr:fibro-slime domain-containing protein [Collinsella sp.]
MSYGRRRGLRPVSPYAIVLALAVALTASFFLPLRAEAAISDHTVPTTSPSGTTINLFDYWVNPDDHLSVSGSGGVNAGHKFQFNDGKGDGPLNQWTGGTSPRPGIVNNTLSDGYPKLSEALGDESLRYLFDSSAQTGKTSHFGVTGLLKVQGGYYVYDSSENYAAYNADKNAFDIYGTWGIDKVGDSSHQGQFFPFDAADKVFKEENGQLVQTGIKADNTGDSHYNGGKPVNHHFGLSMSTRFVQPKGGLTNNNNDMTFEFAGDDDVWVFIDDVLVGDIGGIHNRASLSINFHTGDIKVNDNYNGTLKSKYQKAGKAGDTSWEGNTFADDTNHTLKFFYLERGATDSNMELKFNLVTVPESDIIKFDQDGKFVQSAEFALYKTDENFTDTTNDKNALLGSGTTDEAGHLTLTNDDDNGVINFDDLYNKNHGNKYYLLKETRVPEGYRSSLTATGGSMQLEYVPASAENGAGGVIINRGGMDADSVVWKTGAFAGAKETITAPVNVYKANDDLTKSDETVNLKSGILFAVVLKRDKSANADIKNQNNWYAVSGDPSTGMGYTLAEKPSKAGAIEAAKKDLHAFTLNTSGQYQVEIQNLPGDISKYYYLLSGDARKDAEYTVAIYHTTASSIANANTDNTVHVFSDDLPSGEKNFQRQFTTRLLVTNIQNRLFVQKTDTAGKPVEGAKFGLYTADQVTTDASGKVVLKGEQTPYDTLTTGSVGNPVPLEGAGIFPNTSAGNRPLVNGTYFLKEVSAPKGFLLNDTLTKVIVDDYGVHADAGTDDDGVSTFVGPGALMKSLGQFGAEGDIDNTLTWIKGQRQTSDGTLDGNDNLSWNNDAKGGEDEVHLKHGANGRVYQYGPTEEGKPYRLETETGWIRMGITQDVPGDTNAKGARANLDDMNLNALFTGATCVRVANEREASLEVTKKVALPDGLTGNKDAEFTFKFTVPTTAGKTYKAAVFENAGTASEKQVGKMFDLENGREQTITAGQTIRVYGLAEGDKYTVQELTRAGKMPAGFTLTKREQGGNALGGEGDSISGTIAKQNADGTLAEANKLVFTNTYSVKSLVTLTNAFWAQKVLQGRDWKDGDSFKIYLRADKGTPMPDGAENAPVSGMKQVVKTVENGDKFDFGEIEYTKPGTYTYLIAEATPSQNDASWLPGFGYSSASYRVTVTVKDSGDGTLSQPAVKMEQTYTDDGVSHEDSPIEVADKIAKITNTYNTDEKTISFHVQKTYVDQSGANPLVKDKFTFQLEALGGMKNDAVPSGTLKFGDLAYSVDASKVPMPMGCTSTTTTAKNDDGGIAAFPQITYTMGSENLTYVYRVTEVKDSDTSTSSGMGYDDAVYYVLVKNQQVDNESGTGRCLSSTVTYWKADGTQLTDANGYIPFKNTYTVTQATSAPVTVQKTLAGRAWETSDAFDFTLTPADDATRDAVKNKVVTQRKATDSDETGDLTTKVEIAGAGDATRSATFGVGDLVFTKSGTYTFNVNETKPTDADKTGIAYDGHTSTVTYTVTDIENGKHTGKLTASVAYDNKQATTDADRQVTDAAAFTNIYAASGTYAGIDVTKTLVGTPLKNGMFPFTIEAMTYNGTTAPEPADTDKSFKNTVGKDDGDDTQTATMSGKLKMNFTQLSYNKVYVYKVSEAHGANAGGYTYDTEYPGDAYVLIAVKPNPDNKGQLYTETTIAKGPGVTALVGGGGNVDALTAEAIKGLDTTTNYVKTVSSRNAKPATPTVPFKNSYKSDASDELTPQVTKKISGVESTEKAFSFTLTATEETQQKIAAGDLGVSDDLAGDAHAESKATKDKIIKDKGQTVDFSNMTFNKAGEYTFTLTEVHNADDDPAADGVQNAGWTMDASAYTATVTVEDVDAKLTVTGVTVKKDGDAEAKPIKAEVKDGKVNLATFTNSYAAKGSVTLAAKKRFTGGALAGNDFSFALYKGDKAEGTPIETVTNDEKGNITFQPINYTEAGDYEYTIKEVTGNDQTIVYDGQKVKVKVSVTDNKNGTLDATVTYGGDKAVPTFTNVKPTTDVTVEATKVLAGKALTDGAFAFGLYQGDTSTGNPVKIVQNDKEGKINLALTGLTIGEYDYKLKEENVGADPTITYDTKAVKVHVSVKAEGDKAKATVTYDGKNDAPTFTNKYQPAETSVALTAKKAYVKPDNTPATLKGGEFTFDLYEGDLTAEQLKGKQPIRSAKNSEDGTVTFPAIDYTKAGEYKYTVAEQEGDLSHVTYDATVHHAVVKVMDNAGKLDAAVTYDGDKANAPTFTNTYTAKGSVELTATKIVAVAPGFTHDIKLKGGEYTFELKDADGKVLGTTTNKADGTVKFTRKFTLSNLGGAASKDFTYTIAEKPGTEPGMVYDTHALIYKVTVADDGTGSLTATPQVTSGDKTFTNTYHPKETSVTLKATKRFTGGELAGGDFTFQLLDKDGNVIQTVQNDKDGKVAFQAISYDTPGDHDYTIKEVAGNDPTVVYDTKDVKVHIKVSDEKGELKATATYDGEADVPTFTNSKPTTDVTVEATKILTGKDLTADAFTFGLYDQAGNEVAKGTNDRGGKVELAVKNLNLGEYDYTLKEEKAGQTVDGVAYDAKKVKVHVKVEQNQGDNNKTKVTVTYDGAATAPTFNNTYDAKGSVILTATKTIKVADGFDHTTKPADGEFTFDLKDAAGNVLDTAKNDANGKVSFTREFQLSDLDGAASKDFTYTIVEQPGAEPGMVYDSHPLTYTVTVTDGGNGALNAKAIVTSASGSDTFTNTYQPAATGLALGAQKSYVKKDDNTPIVPKCGEFTFDVYEGNLTAEQLAGAKPVRTATNGADGSVNFDAFSYAKPGTHEYTIVERKGDLAYVTYDAAVHHAVVTVADNAGTLQASVAYDGTNVTKPSFTNTYEAQATDSGAIALTKSVDVHDGSYQLKAGDFAFELVGSDGSVIQTQKNDAHGKVAFDKLTFDHAGTFTYTVREVQPTGDAPGVPGVTYTGKTYTLTYVVKDNNDGKLAVESSTAKPSKGTENGVTPNTMTFANSYQPGATSYQISGIKVLENTDSATMRTPADGEFTFALIDAATGQEIDRTTNAGIAFTFKAISYTATGSHTYQVKEVAGQDGTITYSDAVLDVTVSVTDDGSGQLTATANKTAADLTFTNIYTPTATTATITGTKALTGRDLAEGEFSFDLKDADGNVVQTVQNGADGTFGFAPLQLDKVGTYVYTVSERAGATANGVTYDTTVFTATVTVTENAETHALEAQVAYSKGGKAADAVAFSNSYAPAATEVKLGASKVLSGEDLKEGQFSFQLKDADGKVLQTAKNAADGTVGFEAISYDKPGTYAYSISEVDDGQKNVTYDAAEHRVTVTVTDDGAGHLVATVTYDGDVAPVFKNTYTPPTTPPVNPPTEPPTNPPVSKEEKPGLPNMGDTSLSPMALGGIAGGAVVLIAAGVILRRRNR